MPAIPPVALQLIADALFAPGAALAEFLRIELRRSEGRIVRAEVTNGGRMKARLFLLERPAVERLALAAALAQLEHDRILVPLAIAVDVVGIQTCRCQGAVPASEEARLKRRERRFPQLIAALGHGRPMQVVP